METKLIQATGERQRLKSMRGELRAQSRDDNMIEYRDHRGNERIVNFNPIFNQTECDGWKPHIAVSLLSSQDVISFVGLSDISPKTRGATCV